MSTLTDKAKSVTTRADLVELVRELKRDFEANPKQWTNTDLASFLEALADWMEDMDGYYLNQRKPIPAQPNWSTVADLLMGGRCYE